MKLKLCCLALVLSMMFFGTNASAFTQINDFTVDLSVIDADFGTYNGINQINYDGVVVPNTWITQYLGGDGVLSNGDTFKETGYMTLSSLTPTTINPDLTDGDGTEYFIHLVYKDVTGSIYNYNDNGTPTPTDDTWGYTFDTGAQQSGTLGWYLDNNLDAMDGTMADLMTGSFLPGSAGTTDGFLSGAGASSNWDVTVEVDTLLAGLLLDENGNDLWDTLGYKDWLLTITTGDTTVTAFGESGFDPEKMEAFMTFIGDTGDRTILAAVPEPGTMILLGLGMIGFAAIGRKKLLKS